MALQKYIKRNIEVQAIQFNGSIEQLSELTDIGLKFNSLNDDNTLIKVKTSSGEINATPGDYILIGINGDFSVCKENDFPKLYEKENIISEPQNNLSNKKIIFEFSCLGIFLVLFISFFSIWIYSALNKKNISRTIDILYKEKIEQESKQLLTKAQLEADEIILTAKNNAKIEAANTFREEMTRITNEKIKGAK